MQLLPFTISVFIICSITIKHCDGNCGTLNASFVYANISRSDLLVYFPESVPIDKFSYEFDVVTKICHDNGLTVGTVNTLEDFYALQDFSNSPKYRKKLDEFGYITPRFATQAILYDANFTGGNDRTKENLKNTLFFLKNIEKFDEKSNYDWDKLKSSFPASTTNAFVCTHVFDRGDGVGEIADPIAYLSIYQQFYKRGTTDVRYFLTMDNAKKHLITGPAIAVCSCGKRPPASLNDIRPGIEYIGRIGFLAVYVTNTSVTYEHGLSLCSTLATSRKSIFDTSSHPIADFNIFPSGWPPYFLDQSIGSKINMTKGEVTILADLLLTWANSKDFGPETVTFYYDKDDQFSLSGIEYLDDLKLHPFKGQREPQKPSEKVRGYCLRHMVCMVQSIFHVFSEDLWLYHGARAVI